MSFPTDGFQVFEIYYNIMVDDGSPRFGASFVVEVQATSEGETLDAAFDAGLAAIESYYQTNHPTWSVQVSKQYRGYKND